MNLQMIRKPTRHKYGVDIHDFFKNEWEKQFHSPYAPHYMKSPIYIYLKLMVLWHAMRRDSPNPNVLDRVFN